MKKEQIQHSKGPWSVTTKRGRILIMPAEGVTHIAQVFAFYGIEQCGADVRLIKCAPELLAALKGILAVANVRIDDPRCAQFDAARAIIAKINGETT